MRKIILLSSCVLMMLVAIFGITVEARHHYDDEHEPEPFPCYNCNGTGQCPTCEGSGKIVNENSFKARFS